MQYGHGNGRRGVLTLGRGKQKHVGAGSARSLASGGLTTLYQGQLAGLVGPRARLMPDLQDESVQGHKRPLSVLQ